MSMRTRTTDKWDSLTTAYRDRLSRSGITRELYLSGAPLRAARGHRVTPERPRDAIKHPERFPQYVAKRLTPLESLRQQAKDAAHASILGALSTHSIERFDLVDVYQRIDKTSDRWVLEAWIGDFSAVQDQAASDAVAINNDEWQPWFIRIDGKITSPFFYR